MITEQIMNIRYRPSVIYQVNKIVEPVIFGTISAENLVVNQESEDILCKLLQL
jgi:hypothetical protein